jgi:hypothetical protein
VTTEIACSGDGGDFKGVGTFCDDVPDPCLPPCGEADAPACEGSCEEGFTCVETPGGFSTAGQNDCTCVPNTGACCYEDYDLAVAGGSNGLRFCTIIDEETCVNSLNGEYLGDNVPCGPETCNPTGACCGFETPMANISGCVILGEQQCLGKLGSYQGDGTTCDPDPCVDLGACCLPNGDCLDGMTLETCDRPALFQGAGTTCDSVTCRPPRGGTTQKGSFLYFSKIEIKWDATGNLIQDTFVDITNDFPQGVNVQAYFINGDIEVPELTDDDPDGPRDFEPGWNTADCRFTLTANQPHFWSAANGSDKCQPFTVLDIDGPGRLDPETDDGSRILRGFIFLFAVDFFTVELENPGTFSAWYPIKWNHLKGDVVIVNYANKTAWEYNAWAFRWYGPPQGCPLPGAANIPGCEPIEPEGSDAPPASLLMDFYASGSTALSGGGETVMVDTDLTVHAVSLDLRQDNCGPILTKVEAEIWNENENKFSGTRRCVCCWDQTMLSNWSRSDAIPNHFMREALGTDKGTARLEGVASIECDYLELCGPTAFDRMWQCGFDSSGVTAGIPSFTEDAAILGLATKFLTYTPSGKKDTAGMNLVGVGAKPAFIIFDLQTGPDSFLSDRSPIERGEGSSEAKGATAQTGATMMIELGQRLPNGETPSPIKDRKARDRGSMRRWR